MSYLILGQTGIDLRSSFFQRPKGSYPFIEFRRLCPCGDCFSRGVKRKKKIPLDDGIPYGPFTIFKKNLTSEYRYIADFNLIREAMEHVCYSCLVKREKKHINHIGDYKLPLFINHVWVTEKGEKLFRKQLKAVVV